MPNLSGLFGINWINGQRVFVGKSCSSTVKNWLGKKLDL